MTLIDDNGKIHGDKTSATGGTGSDAGVSVVRIIQTGSASPLLRTRFIEVEDVPVRFPNGVEGSYLRVNPDTFGGIAIARHVFRGVPRYALVEQHRFPIDAVTLEFPRGGTQDASAPECLRELQEETALEVHDLPLNLGRVHADTGLLATEINVWLFTVAGDLNPEHIEVETGARHRWVTDGELAGLIRRGEITCGLTLAAYAKLLASTHHHVAY